MIRVCADGEVVLPGDTAAVDKGVVHLRIGPGLAPATGTCVFITVAGLDVQSPLFSLHVLSFLPPPHITCARAYSFHCSDRAFLRSFSGANAEGRCVPR